MSSPDDPFWGLAASNPGGMGPRLIWIRWRRDCSSTLQLEGSEFRACGSQGRYYCHATGYSTGSGTCTVFGRFQSVTWAF
jgi:hypothetical protein